MAKEDWDPFEVTAKRDYNKWLRHHRDTGTQFFLHRTTGRLYKLLNFKVWCVDYRGYVRLQAWERPQDERVLSYRFLTGLTDMEAVAYAARG